MQLKPGVLPLGNLFDGKTVPLDGALSSDAFGATAEPSDLGVLKTAFGWGERIHIGPEIDFDFVHLGADDRAYGKVSNDSWLGRMVSPPPGKAIRLLVSDRSKVLECMRMLWSPLTWMKFVKRA